MQYMRIIPNTVLGLQAGLEGQLTQPLAINMKHQHNAI